MVDLIKGYKIGDENMYFGSVKFYKHLIYLLIIFTISFTSILLYSLYTDFKYSESYAVQSYYSVNDILKTYGTSRFDFNDSQINKVENMIPSETTLTEMEKGGVYYQELYPDLKCELPVFKQVDEKKAYLTIDDGPTERTLEILDILKEKDVKATFFVVGENTDLDILKRVHDEGHTIGVHSNSHNYNKIYSSVEDFLNDFYAIYTKIYNVTSEYPTIFRFPGGSVNSHNLGVYEEIISEMLRRGFVFYDWNISTEDTTKNITSNKIVENVINQVKNQDKLIILAHDTRDKVQTVKAIPEIIDYLHEQNYTFDRLTNEVYPINFSYKK